MTVVVVVRFHFFANVFFHQNVLSYSFLEFNTCLFLSFCGRIDFLKSTSLLERLNLSNNALSEFDGAILSHSKQITELDLSHNQITTLKLNEVRIASLRTFALFVCFDNVFHVLCLFRSIVDIGRITKHEIHQRCP